MGGRRGCGIARHSMATWRVCDDKIEKDHGQEETVQAGARTTARPSRLEIPRGSCRCLGGLAVIASPFRSSAACLRLARLPLSLHVQYPEAWKGYIVRRPLQASPPLSLDIFLESLVFGTGGEKKINRHENISSSSSSSRSTELSFFGIVRDIKQAP